MKTECLFVFSKTFMLINVICIINLKFIIYAWNIFNNFSAELFDIWKLIIFFWIESQQKACKEISQRLSSSINFYIIEIIIQKSVVIK
jgi:hypothetical protein